VPTYQYRCTECGEPLEVVQSFTDPALTSCPSCQGQLRKVFSPVGVVFKGSGFYRNDSRPSPAAAETAADSGKVGKQDKAGKEGAAAKEKAGASSSGSTSTPPGASKPSGGSNSSDGSSAASSAVKQ
jgi:putative FmdB family regulatory protein